MGNVGLALSVGAHGVWLVNSGDAGIEGLDAPRRVHRTKLKAGSTSDDVIGQAQLKALGECFQAVRDAFPDAWVGLCVPQLNAAQSFTWVEKNCVTADAL